MCGSFTLLHLSFSVCTLLVGVARSDVAHLHPPEFHGFFSPHHQHQYQYPFHVPAALQPAFVVPQPVVPPQSSTTLPTLYNAPPANDVGYAPAFQPVTHSPVAPTRPGNAATATTRTPPSRATTTTEFILPEIVENRSYKVQQNQQQHHYHNFIPLNNIFGGGSNGVNNQYLPPSIDTQRPNYDSPGVGYYYSPPTTTSTTTTTTTERPRPIVVEEPPSLPFLPPLSDTPVNTGGLSYDYNAPGGPAFTLPPPPQSPGYRPSTPAPVYLPPNTAVNNAAPDNTNAIIVEHLDPNVPPLRVRIQEMRCLHQSGGGGGYFRSVLKLNSFISTAPSIEDAANGSGGGDDKRCEPRLTRSSVLLDVAEEDFGRCGVRTCGKDLCLRLRFPAIRGMRTNWDSILTLHCKVQDRVAVKTHALKMGVTNEAQARSLGTYARGGAQNPFRTHIELQRRNSDGGGGYVRLQDSRNGNTVQLGEELLLRAHVIPGDGWNYTKLSDISLQRISATGELLNAANLISPHGCLNPTMQNVCSQVPIFEPPLGHRLAFRAVMFQGMQSGDELVLSMRITGCLEQSDCQVSTLDCNANTEHDSGSINPTHRRRRDLTATHNATEISEVSRIAFRVLLPDNATSQRDVGVENLASTTDVVHVAQRTIALAGSVLFVAALAFVGLFAWWWQLKLKM